MKAVFESWLSQISPEVGIIACGVRLPDGSFVTHSFSYDFPEDQWQAVWQKLDETVQTFSVRHLPVARQCWTFERHYLLWIMRQDGLALGILTTQESAEAHEQYYQSLLEAFLSWTNQAAA
jgi:hypothetical protein